MSRARRVDGNHAAIVRELRQVGAVVVDLHEIPGALDLLVAFRHKLYILEIKDGTKPPSERRLTKAEEETIGLLASVGVKAHVVLCADDALKAVGAMI